MRTSANTEEILEVGAFYQLLTARLESAFGRRHPHWVRGEIAKVYEKGHVYVDLVDAGSASSDAKRPVLNAHCWATPWGPLKKKLAAEGVTLSPGLIVNFYGYVDVYAPQGKIGFTITQIDVQGLLGDVARRRAELIARLSAEGLLEANKRVALSPVPLRVGLVASPGTEGYSDFTGQLLHSGYGFRDRAREERGAGRERAGPDRGGDRNTRRARRRHHLRGSRWRFQGRPRRVRRRTRGARDRVVVRRRSSRASVTPATNRSPTSWRIPARSPRPSSGRRSRRSSTNWHGRHVRLPAQRVLDATTAVVDEATEYVAERRRTMIFAVRDRLRAEQRHLASTRGALLMHSRHLLNSSAQKLASNRALLSAYDPKRRLAQGWSIVTSRDGAVVKSLDDVSVGDAVTVLVSDGSFESTVSAKTGVTP